MPRTKSSLSKSNQKRLESYYKGLVSQNPDIDIDKLSKLFSEAVFKDARGIKEASEKEITELYIEYGSDLALSKPEDYISEIAKVTFRVRNQIIKKHTDKTFDDNIDIYFNDVKREYIRHPQNESNDLEFIPENRDIFIANNLKLAVSIAKKYRNMGLPFEDLIQAANIGLLNAFDKFDATRNTLRSAVIRSIESSPNDVFSFEDAYNLLAEHFTYDNMLEKSKETIPTNGFASKECFIEWTKKNVKTAVFASVAYRWIMSAITQELDHYKSVIKFPKKSGSKEDDDDAFNQANIIINIDSINPYTDDNYSDGLLEEVTREEFVKEDDQMVEAEKNEYFKDVLEHAMAGLSNTDMRIIKKKFGIDYPSELSNIDIAESEHMSSNEVKASINRSMMHIAKNIPDSARENLLELFS